MSAQITRLAYNIFISFEVETLTGLAIGGSDTGIQIGGVDKVVIRNPFNDEPYIPGSSLRGKIRSSLEKALGLRLNQSIGSHVTIHSAKSKADYDESPVCQLFGVTGENEWSRPSRLIVRDIALSVDSKVHMEKSRMDLPYTEVKVEVAIDRITSAANPRNLERVPAGAVFGPGQMVLSVYEEEIERIRSGQYDPLNLLFTGMLLVEHSSLGGNGARGSGQVRFRNIVITGRQTVNTQNQLAYGEEIELRRASTLTDFGSSLNLIDLLGSGE